MLKLLVHRFSSTVLPRSLITPEGILNENFLVAMRKSVQVRNIDFDLEELKTLCQTYEQDRDENLLEKIQVKAFNLPNLVHPLTPVGPPEAFRIIYTGGKHRDYVEMKPEEACNYATNLRDKGFSSLRRKRIKGFVNKNPSQNINSSGLNCIKFLNVACGSVQRTLYLQSTLVDLSDAIINYSLDKLKGYEFQQIIVPEVIPRLVLNAAGFPTDSKRSQVYHISKDSLSHNDWCLIGTSEQSLAAFCSGRQVDLGLGENPESTNVYALCSLSKCFRQEISSTESFLYRTHQFKKVEMFAVTAPNLVISDAMFMKMLKIQIELCESLNLHFRVLEMPTSELGPSAFRKVDIEAWMPGEKIFGEVSSLSNCTDYQALRLNINCINHDASLVPAHTLNGTACAIPRLLKSILESNQNPDGSITVPPVLVPYMRNKTDHIHCNDAYVLVWLAKMNSSAE